jgi:prepilin-type N-terminal cleavage/methylation domain-containing protein
MRTRTGKRRAGFTLVELLVVIIIIAILASLMLTGIGAAFRRMRITKAKNEVKAIEVAWRQYYTEYRRWPSIGGVPPPQMEIIPIRLSGEALQILMGNNINNSNPKELKFLSSFDSVNASGTPINPWGDKDLDDGSTPPDSFYYMKFDVTFDNAIQSGSGVDNPPTESLARPVMAWTINSTKEVGDPARIVGSW